jgi:hypothetical protein
MSFTGWTDMFHGARQLGNYTYGSQSLLPRAVERWSDAERAAVIDPAKDLLKI